MNAEKKQKNGGLLIALASLVYFTSYLTRLNFGAVLVEFLGATGLSSDIGGLIGSALFFSYGFGQLISGFLGDRLPPQYIILGGIVTTAVCNFLFPFLAQPWMFIAVWGINGLAQAMFWPPLVRILAANFAGERYATATSAVITVSQVTNILIYLVVPAAILTLGWHYVFYIPAAVAVAVGIVWAVLYAPAVRACKTPDTGKQEVSAEQKADVPKTKEPLLPLLFSCGMPLILLAIASQGFLRDGITTWLPTALTELYAMEEASSILMSVLLPIFGILTIYAVSFLYRRILRNEVRGAALFFFIGAVSSVLLYFTFGVGAAFMVVFSSLLTGLMHGINLLLISYIPGRFAARGTVSTVSGITNAATYIGSTLSSYLFAVLASNIGWQNTILFWGAVCLLGMFACVFAVRRWDHFCKN